MMRHAHGNQVFRDLPWNLPLGLCSLSRYFESMDALRKAVLERKRAAQAANEGSNKAPRPDDVVEDEADESSDSSSEESDSSDDSSASSSAASSKASAPQGSSPSDNEVTFAKEHAGAITNPDAKRVYSWMVEIIERWSAELDARPDAERASGKGRQATAAFEEALRQLAILASTLRSNTLDKNILDHLVGIVYECDRREYRAAFDRYIQLTIGNAAWPIGVTMVGIHARSGREKIAESKVKHIMKDETVRAYLTSFKRLMSKCQEIHPPSAPSKKMN